MAKGKFVISKDAAGEYRWLLRASNGEPIADSNEGYSAHKDCVNGVKLVIDYAKSAAIEDTTGEGAPAAKAAKKAAAKAATGAKPAAKKKAAKKK